ncbi:MAG: hypothetical protein QOE90_2543 [Thermoplasmata archaeon]|jgi:hypothetical protein|nr:hypothetical protein [Thermoplasmata archaeon]
MRATLPVLLILGVLPSALAGASSFDAQGDDCQVDLVATSFQSPAPACAIEVHVSLGFDAQRCSSTTCTFTTQGNATYVSSVPGFQQALFEVYNPQTGSPATCIGAGALPDTAVTCEGATGGNVVTVSAGQCRPLFLYAFGYTAVAPSFGAPSILHVTASRQLAFCRDSHGNPSIS